MIELMELTDHTHNVPSVTPSGADATEMWFWEREAAIWIC